jgi:hypothetical protein
MEQEAGYPINGSPGSTASTTNGHSRFQHATIQFKTLAVFAAPHGDTIGYIIDYHRLVALRLVMKRFFQVDWGSWGAAS